MGEAEKNAARVFDADKTYFVLGGTSAANQIIFGACASRGDDVIIDRNCHKSIYHALISSGANPLYISPLRNKMGMAGPIPPESIAQALGARASAGELPRILTITNSNYDGVCTSVLPFEQNPPAANLHFDEAWFAHAKFSPIYDGFSRSAAKRRPCRYSYRSPRTRCFRLYRKGRCSTQETGSAQNSIRRDRGNLRNAYLNVTAIRDNCFARRCCGNNGKARAATRISDIVARRRFAQNYRWKKVVRRVEGRLVFWSMATRICKNRQ